MVNPRSVGAQHVTTPDEGLSEVENLASPGQWDRDAHGGDADCPHRDHAAEPWCE
ncbi:MAG: hypothetical protein ACI8Y4_001959 [Candidatus Poriferisodalaceae bacterium]|jgi:hypothetical protein